MAAIPKLINAGPLPAAFDRFGHPRPVLLGTGTTEAIAALLPVAGIATVDPARIAGSCILIAVMGGALATHQRVRDPPAEVAPPLILAIAATVELLLYASS